MYAAEYGNNNSGTPICVTPPPVAWPDKIAEIIQCLMRSVKAYFEIKHIITKTMPNYLGLRLVRILS